MSSIAEAVSTVKRSWPWVVGGGAILLIWAAVALPPLERSIQTLPRESYAPVAGFHAGRTTTTGPLTTSNEMDASKARSVLSAATPADAGRKIIRTSSLDMVVLHPAEAAEEIEAVAEKMGGYVVSSAAAGQTAAFATLTVRVPAERFEQARAQIRKLGVRIENERVDAQDVTRQYVDQDARIRNLKAEESQYLAILRQATTVKDMMAVSEKVSEVRGEIEQQQAEFSALSQQVDTVAIAISLRTESEAQVFGLNWRPGYQLKLAMHDGLESVATYATAMATILFYLPAVLLWTGTILLAGVGGWRTVRWAKKRWLVSSAPPIAARE